MKKFIVKRLMGLVPTLFVIITISFFIIRLAPGGPFSMEKDLPSAVLANLEAKYHLDEPLLMQYARYMGGIIKGDFGLSLEYLDRNVSYFIKQHLPTSMFLGVLVLVLSLLIGLSAGITSAFKQNTWVDYVIMSGTVIGISVPLFVVGPLLMYVFAIKLHWLPTSGWIGDRNGMLTMLMPVITLSFPYTANIARLTRASAIEVFHSDYVRTAYAKGLSTIRIIIWHVLKGSITPVISYIGPMFAAIVTSSVVVESIFRIPGLGKFFVQSSFNRDYTLIMGMVITYSAILLMMNFLVDILYVCIDKRVLKGM